MRRWEENVEHSEETPIVDERVRAGLFHPYRESRDLLRATMARLDART
jgi:hypothetical protein